MILQIYYKVFTNIHSYDIIMSTGKRRHDDYEGMGFTCNDGITY